MALAPPLTPPQPAYRPYVPASDAPAEFTLQAVVLGVLFGLLFGASTVYLGLRAGLTVSASIPIAVLAISALKRLAGATFSRTTWSRPSARPASRWPPGPFQLVGNAFPWFRAESGLAQLASGLLFLSLAAITAGAARRTL